jgi:hypothetical protein
MAMHFMLMKCIQKLVLADGIEPSASALSRQRSDQLSYASKDKMVPLAGFEPATHRL